MSQGFPPPSGPPGLNYQGPRDYRRPQRDPLEYARRASILLFILGGLIALHGIGNCALAFTFSGEELVRQNQQMLPTSQPSGGLPQLSPLGTKLVLGVGGCLEVVVGLGIMLLGSPVRRGRSWAVITSIVAVCLIGGFAILMLLAFVLFSVVAPAMIGVACVLVVPMTLCGLLLRWLVQMMQAMRAAGPNAGSPPIGWSAATSPTAAPPQPGPGRLPGGTEYSPYAPPSQSVSQRPARYGYAQAPIPQPPAGDAPVGPPPHNFVPPPDPVPDSGNAEKRPDHG